MRVCKINNLSFSANNTQEKKSDFLSKFHENARNQADMTDTVVVPRTIFKGYLGFMAGTTLTSIGALLKNHPKTSKTLNIAGSKNFVSFNDETQGVEEFNLKHKIIEKLHQNGINNITENQIEIVTINKN
jgi:hypothetical protein